MRLLRGGSLLWLLLSAACGGGGSERVETHVDLLVERAVLVESLAPGWTGAETDPVPLEPEMRFFEEDACELQPDEGTVGGPGWRRLVTFSTTIWNRGTADLVIGAPQAPEAPWTVDDFRFSPCHGHTHFTAEWIEYRLRDVSGLIVGFGHKQGWCIEDGLNPEGLRPHFGERRYDCGYMGIQAGFGDLYVESLPGQWIDVTGVPPGEYTLEIDVNPTLDPRMDEPPGDGANNVCSVLVSLPPE